MFVCFGPPKNGVCLLIFGKAVLFTCQERKGRRMGVGVADINVYIYLYMHVCICIYIYISAVYIYIYVQMCICVCIYIYICNTLLMSFIHI